MANKRTQVTKARRRWLALMAVIAVALGGAWIFYGDGLRKTGATGTAYAARVACSCRFVAGRGLDDCAKDKLEGMGLVRLSEDAEAKSVTASIPLVASDTASYRKGYGCVLQEWQG